MGGQLCIAIFNNDLLDDKAKDMTQERRSALSFGKISNISTTVLFFFTLVGLIAGTGFWAADVSAKLDKLSAIERQLENKFVKTEIYEIQIGHLSEQIQKLTEQLERLNQNNVLTRQALNNQRK